MMEGKYYSPVKSQWDADSQISRRPVIRGDDLLIEAISSVTKKCLPVPSLFSKDNSKVHAS